MSPSDNGFFDKAKELAPLRSGQLGTAMTANPGTQVDAVARMSNTEKLRRTIEYAVSSPSLPIEFKRALSELLSPENLAIAASVMLVWAGSHFFGVGEVVDAILIGTAYVTLGLQGMRGLADLVEFGYDVINAESDFDLRRASEKLVGALAALGAEVVLALLTRKAQIKLSGAKGPPVSRGPSPKSNAPPRNSEPPSVMPPKPSYRLGNSDGGPGQWVKPPKRSKGVEYQRQITEAPRDADLLEYAVPANTPSGRVLFDGYKDGKLIDTKDWTKWPPADKDFWHKGVADDAMRQVEAANGTPIEWHFPDEGKADVVSKLLKDRGIDGIDVKVSPKK